MRSGFGPLTPKGGSLKLIQLDPARKDQAVQVYARAFFDYPLVALYFPDRARRERVLTPFFEVQVNYGFLYGQNYTTPDTTGIACWLPPGSTYLTIPRLARAGGVPVIPKIGFLRLFTRVLKYESFVGQIHHEVMPGPHYYLAGIAVEPSRQGTGIGTALVRLGLDQADRQGVPAYLETHTQENVRYYQKLGFTILRQERLPGFDLNIWYMAS